MNDEVYDKSMVSKNLSDTRAMLSHLKCIKLYFSELELYITFEEDQYV